MEHCVPLDKCNKMYIIGNILIYQQLYVKKPSSILENVSSMCTAKRKLENDYFITITG